MTKEKNSMTRWLVQGSLHWNNTSLVELIGLVLLYGLIFADIGAQMSSSKQGLEGKYLA
jgi:hypothetical protein